jgi:ribosome assembly protein 1
VGPNMLICRPDCVYVGDRSVAVPAGAEALMSPRQTADGSSAPTSTSTSASEPDVDSRTASQLRNALSAVAQGFQLVTASGPLCAEPLWGVAFIVERLAFKAMGDGLQIPPSASGQLIGLARDAMRVAVESSNPRLVEAMFRCELQCSGGGGALGELYGVLSKRRGRVISEDMWEGTSTFVINAYLPVAESFGFADDLRSSTSGAATSPQLVWSHWEVMPQDPKWVPSTASEKEEYGDMLYEGQLANRARVMMDAVRQRKGLAIDRKIVVSAEKQRTRKR